MKIKLNVFIDFLGKFVSLTFILLVVFRCLKIKFFSSLLLSIFISIAVFLGFYIIKSFFRSKNAEKEQDAIIIKDIEEQFKYTKQSKITNYFYKLFSQKFIVHTHKLGFTYVENDKKILVINCFNNQILSANDVLYYYKETQDCKISKLRLFCFQSDKGLFDLVSRFKKIQVEICDLNLLYYEIIKPSRQLPTFEIEKITIPKFSFKAFFLSALSRRKAKSYFWFGVLLFTSSFFVPMSIYYLIMSLILFTMSFLARFIVKQPNL